MRRLPIFLLLSFVSCLAALAAEAPKKPKLIVAIAIDQFRYDYLLRFRSEYTAGLKTLLDKGAVFDDAHQMHSPTVTAVGHSTYLSGATPSMSGIVGNSWYDWETKSVVTSVQDNSTKLIGGVPGAIGSSPRRLLVSTVGDELKMQGAPLKVIGISIKDRSSILPSGHMADGSYWYDDDSKHWVTSSFYTETLPDWVREANDARPNAKSVGASWLPLDAKSGDKPFCTMVAGVEGVRSCGTIDATPWGNEMIEDFAERAIVAEKLGSHNGTDLLTVSYSSNDYVGHAVGPDAPEVRDISRRTDLLIGKLIALVDKQVGLANATFVLTADHGVAPVPEVNAARKMPGGRVPTAAINNAIESALSARFGAGKWILSSVESSIYFDRATLDKFKVSESDAEKVAAEAARRVPHIFRVYTAEELRAGNMMNDLAGRALMYGYYGPRSGNLVVVLDPYYLPAGNGTSHSTPFDYDSHVPVIFMGPGIKAGHYYDKIAVNDIAPTLAAIARIETPSGSIGRVLQEMWQ